MARFGFESVGEFMLFLTSLSAGMSIIIGINAICADPKFMLDYYKYIKDNKDAKPEMPEFWDKVLTYYFLITAVTQLIVQPLNLTPFFARFSLLFRLETGSVLMFVELLIVCLMPHTTSSEVGAVAGIVVAAFIGGVGRALYENSIYSLLGPCHPKMVVASVVGLPTSAVIMSILQIVLLATLKGGFYDILHESIIYFSAALFIVFLPMVLLASLVCNSYAKRYIAELRSNESLWPRIYTSPKRLQLRSIELARQHGAQTSFPDLVVSETKTNGLTTEEEGDELKAISTAEMLYGVSLLSVIKKTYPMLIACFLDFSVTCLLCPGVLLQVDKPNTWYVTLIIATFNVFDLIGRLSTLSKRMHMPPRGVLIVSILRSVLVPLLILCSEHVIKGKIAPYIFTVALGLTGGYTGSMSMMYTVSTPELKTAGERSMAGQVVDIVLLLGVSVGTFIQIFCLEQAKDAETNQG